MREEKAYDTLFHYLASTEYFGKLTDTERAEQAATLIINGCPHNLPDCNNNTPRAILRPFKDKLPCLYAVLKAADIKNSYEQKNIIPKITNVETFHQVLSSKEFNKKKHKKLRKSLDLLLDHYVNAHIANLTLEESTKET